MRFWLKKSLQFPVSRFERLLMGYKWDTVSFLNRKADVQRIQQEETL
jgi:hypothetical protein